jgi:hypothetical protein
VQDPVSHRAVSKAEEEGAGPIAADPDLPLTHGEVVTQVRRHLCQRRDQSGTPNKATRENLNCSSAASISAVRGRMRSSNLGRHCDVPRGGGGGGDSRVWHDGDHRGSNHLRGLVRWRSQTGRVQMVEQKVDPPRAATQGPPHA